MGDTTIRVSEEVKARLDLHKRPDESYEDVIVRLTERDQWAGFGVLTDADSCTREGMAELREQLREGMATDVEEHE